MFLESLIFGIIAILAVALNAYGDAKSDKENVRIHWAEIAPIGMLIISIILIYFLPNFYSLSLNLIAFYLIFRIGFFATLYNKFRGDLPIGYIGKTSIYDQFLNFIFNKIIEEINYFRKKLGKEEIVETTKVQYIKNCISGTLSIFSLFFGAIILFSIRFNFPN